MFEGMVDFINKSPTPFHAVAQCVTSLKAKGFEALSERDAWVGAIKPGGPPPSPLRPLASGGRCLPL